MQPRRARSVRLAGYKARATGRFEERAVNGGVFAELELPRKWALGLVTNYGIRALTDSVKVGARKSGFSFRRRRRPFQTRHPRGGEAADRSSDVEVPSHQRDAHRASGL